MSVIQILTKDGRKVDVFLTLSEAKLGAESVFTAFVKDITEQKAQQRETEMEIEKNRQILDGCVDSVVIIDDKNIIRMTQRAPTTNNDINRP